jgi:hypothetical protein
MSAYKDAELALSAKANNGLSIDRVRCTRKTGRWLASRS